MLERASNGVLRKLYLSHSGMTKEQAKELRTILHTEPCPLMTLDVSSCYIRNVESGASTPTQQAPTEKQTYCFAGLTLDQLLSKKPLMETIPETDGSSGDRSSQTLKRRGSVSQNGHTQKLGQQLTQKICCWRLRDLRLTGCGLEGTLPLALRDCPELLDLRLGSNQLTGRLPEWLFDPKYLPKLRTVYLAFNQFYGSIPETFSKSHVTGFWARDNELHGELPRCPETLEVLHLLNNKLGRLADGCFEGCSGLAEINLKKNQIASTFPELPELPKLGESVFEPRTLTAHLLSSCHVCGVAEGFFVAENQISGTIPKETFRNRMKLKFFEAQANKLTGGLEFPDEENLLPNIRSLFVHDNNLEGQIPTLPANLSKFNASNNKLSGPTEQAFKKMTLDATKTKLKEVDVSNQKDGNKVQLPENVKELNGKGIPNDEEGKKIKVKC